MNYRSLDDLSRDIAANLHRVPEDVCLVVGVPRSGMLAATLIALVRNLPLTDVRGLLDGRLLGGGQRDPGGDFQQLLGAGRVLVVDDSISTGHAMRQVREQLSALPDRCRMIFAAVYATPKSRDQVDLCFDSVPAPRVFEWNVLHHGHLIQSCVDIDGVLCPDPNEADDDDGPRYLRFLEQVPPRLCPKREIGWLVTGRLEKYRQPTEQWLAKHGIRYRHLLMLDHPSASARRRDIGAIARFKAQVYHQSKAVLFIESDPVQAATIAQESGRDVYCVAARQMIQPGQLRRARHAVRQWIGDTHWSIRLALQRATGPHVAASHAADRRAA